MPVLYVKRNHARWLTLARPEACNYWGEDFNFYRFMASPITLDAKEIHAACASGGAPKVRGA